VNRPTILQVARGDRYELRYRFARMAEEARLGQIRFAEDAREIDRVFADTQPDPTVVLDGDHFSIEHQRRFERLMRTPDLAPRLIMLTEIDPGELFQQGCWRKKFRSLFQTYRWPVLQDRDPADIEKIILAFMLAIREELKREHDIDFTMRKGGVELFAKLLIPLKPETVHRLWNASRKLIDELIEADVTELSGTTMRDAVFSQGWQDLTAPAPLPEPTQTQDVIASA